MNAHPHTLFVWVDLALAMQGPATGTIAQPFGTGHRANKLGLIENALPASMTIKHHALQEGFRPGDGFLDAHCLRFFPLDCPDATILQGTPSLPHR